MAQHFSSSPNLLPCNSWPMFLTPLSLQNIVYSSYLFQDLACHLSAVSLRNISMICFINPLSSLSNSKPVTDGYSLSCSISAWYFSHVLEIPSWKPRTLWIKQWSWPGTHSSPSLLEIIHFARITAYTLVADQPQLTILDYKYKGKDWYPHKLTTSTVVCRIKNTRFIWSCTMQVC